MLSKLSISNEGLTEALREHGVDDFKDFKPAMLEVDGSIITGNKNLKETHYKPKHQRKTLGFNN